MANIIIKNPHQCTYYGSTNWYWAELFFESKEFYMLGAAVIFKYCPDGYINLVSIFYDGEEVLNKLSDKEQAEVLAKIKEF